MKMKEFMHSYLLNKCFILIYFMFIDILLSFTFNLLQITA